MINLCAHGFPKSGNHALVKACQLLGVPCDVEHREFAQGLPVLTTHDVLIKRDPRNVVISKLREEGQPVTVGMFLQKAKRFTKEPLSVELARYEPWLEHAGFVVRFEDLASPDVMVRESVMKSIASYLGVKYREGAAAELPGLTRTYNVVKSDYRTIWSDDLEYEWNVLGGAFMLNHWGY